MISITINGVKIRLEKPVTVLEAAEMQGIEIPHLCSHPLLETYGGCRLCVVEVENMRGLQTSCTLEAKDGMVIHTESPEITKSRKATLEFLLISHPLDCHRCDKSGECELQDYTVQYGPTAGRFSERKKIEPDIVKDSFIDRSMERCIMCTRCVRMCRDVQGAEALSVVGKGKNVTIETFTKGEFDCEYCGNCITVCPVGAIMSRLHRYSYRPWQTEQEVQTICPHCGVGCSLILQVREDKIQRVVPKIGLGVSNGLLCARGYFGYGYISSAMRLTTPMVRRDGDLEPASWDEALDIVSKRMSEIKERHGGSSIAGIASARCTNEENYLFQKLMRAGFNTNNIDSIARMGLAGARKLLDGLLGQGSTANVLSSVPDSDAVLVVGGDPTRVTPVMGIMLRNAFRKGARVITMGYTPGLERHRTVSLMSAPYTEGIVLGGLLKGLLKSRQLPGQNPRLEKMINELALPSEDETEGICSIDDMMQAVNGLSEATSISIIVGRELAARTDGGRNIALLGALAYILNARIYLMSEEPNENGLLDMGCVPDMLPGERPVDMPAYSKRYGKAWEAKIPSEIGLTLMELIERAHSGDIKAMYVMGENPVFNFPDRNLVRDALKNLEFLVVQDIFMTETAELADVVLPAMSWAEKDGTYVNLERRIQVLPRAVRGKGMEDWRIIAKIGSNIGLDMPFDSAEQIMAEIARVSPLHFGLSYDEINQGADLWPYMGEPLSQAPSPELDELYEKPDVHIPDELYVKLDKPLFVSGTISRHSRTLGSLFAGPAAKISIATAKKHSINDGDTVEVSTSRGSIQLPVMVEKGVPDNAVLMTNNFRGKGIMNLLHYNIEPFTKAPVMKSSKVTIKAVNVMSGFH